MTHIKYIFSIVALILPITVHSSHNQEIVDSYTCDDHNNCRQHIAAIKKALTTGKEEVAKYISFPINRQYPLPPILTQQQFIYQYDEIFDETLISLILNSNPDRDWQPVGWRGVLLSGQTSPYSSGILWMTYDGKIRAIHYHSKYEKIKRKYLIEHKKAKIHSSLRNYIAPVLNWETKNYFIRVDLLENEDLRYVAWQKPKNQKSRASLVLKGGIEYFNGTSNPSGLIFQNGKYYYVLIPNFTHADGVLKVYKDMNNNTNCKEEGFVSILGETKPCLLMTEEVIASE